MVWNQLNESEKSYHILFLMNCWKKHCFPDNCVLSMLSGLSVKLIMTVSVTMTICFMYYLTISLYKIAFASNSVIIHCAVYPLKQKVWSVKSCKKTTKKPEIHIKLCQAKLGQSFNVITMNWFVLFQIF